jgi:hypothetical protein
MRRSSLGAHHLRLPGAGHLAKRAQSLHDGRPWAVGKSQIHHNLYLTSTKLLEGEPLRVVSHKVDLGGRTLRWLVERLDKRHTYAAAKIHRAAYPGCRPLGGRNAEEAVRPLAEHPGLGKRPGRSGRSRADGFGQRGYSFAGRRDRRGVERLAFHRGPS